MALMHLVGNVGQVARQIQYGDLAVDGSKPNTVNSNAAVTLTAGQLAGGIVLRTGTLGGATNDTLPTAEDFCANFMSDNARPAANAQFRLRYVNVATSQTITLVAGTGGTVSGTATVATATWREFLVQFVATKPTVVTLASITNGQPSVTALPGDFVRKVEVGMLVTGTGIPASTTVIGVSDNLITLSANATATNANATLTFSPTYTVTNIGAGTA